MGYEIPNDATSPRNLIVQRKVKNLSSNINMPKMTCTIEANTTLNVSSTPASAELDLGKPYDRVRTNSHSLARRALQELRMCSSCLKR